MSGPTMLRHFTGGFVRLHILHHAALGEIHGLEMIRELRSHGYALGAGTLYPILHDLEQSGLLRSHPQVVGGKRRINYRITPRGSRALLEAKEKLRELFAELLGGESHPAKKRTTKKTGDGSA